MTTPDSVTRSILVPVDAARAWAGFVDDFAGWWPPEHCFCGEAALERVFLGPEGASWGEVVQGGAVIPWGAVITAQAPSRLVLGWQMDATVSPWVPEPDPDRASLIEVDFAPEGDGTCITLTHHGFARQGEPHAQAMREVMIGLDRWGEWLQLYAAALARKA